MKNKLIIIFLSIFFLKSELIADEIDIQSKNILIDKKKEVITFENQVKIKDTENNIIESEYAEFNKKTGFIFLKKNIVAKDRSGNLLKSQKAEYNEITKIFRTIGTTNLKTSENYIIESSDIFLDNKKNTIRSKKPTTITDLDNNKIILENFEYISSTNIFKSIGNIQILDSKGNSYQFSQIYINEKKKEIAGSDLKAYLNDKSFKINENNKPRIFSNSVRIEKLKSEFIKSAFTICDYRENDKCPPWEIKASKMLHDKEKKTVFYDNAIIKFYDIPIFYLPKLNHPDPTVQRRSGFLPPSFSDTKNLGTSVSIPYYVAIDRDKDFTFTNKLFVSENPLFLGEYRQAFENSNFILDMGYTEGYKKTSTNKRAGEKSHLFGKFTKVFEGKNNSINNFSINFEDVSNDKYLKLYKIKSNLVDYNKDTLQNSIEFTHENDDLFLGINANVYETLKDDYNDKYEYILPDITFDKNLFSGGKFGNLDLNSNFKVRNFDTNKTTKFFVNNFDWDIKKINFKNGIRGEFLSKIKNINYDVKNSSKFKSDTTSEIFGALGFLTEVDLYKNVNNNSHILTPKALFRYAPGHMRKDNSGARINSMNIFSLDRLGNQNNFENGLSATLGFDYEVKGKNKLFNLSIGQVVNEKENKDMPSKSSLDEKISDLVGTTKLKLNDTVDLNYNFALDQNYQDLNYNEMGASINLNPIKLNFDYLQEKKHIGNGEFVKTSIEIAKGDDGKFSFENKRNLITNSSEYYDLSYEYLNDCLRAGIVYRREFYNDSELEPENSLMFKLTFIPFGDINTPSINR